MNTIAQENGFVQVLSEINCKNHIKLINFLLHLDQKFKSVFISQRALGAHIGVNREQANRLTQRFMKLGILIKIKRYNKTSVYKMSHWFKVFAVQLQYKFWSLRKWAKKLLQQAWNQERTSRIYRNINIPVYSYNHLHEKERLMDKFEISPALRKITGVLKLTKWGQIKLSHFPDEILLKGLECYQKYSSNVKDPFTYLFSYCKEHCNGSDREINWKKYYDLADQYNMPQNAPMVITKPKSSFTIPSTSDLIRYFEKQKSERRKRIEQLNQEEQNKLKNAQQAFLDMLTSPQETVKSEGET